MQLYRSSQITVAIVSYWLFFNVFQWRRTVIQLHLNQKDFLWVVLEAGCNAETEWGNDSKEILILSILCWKSLDSWTCLFVSSMKRFFFSGSRSEILQCLVLWEEAIMVQNYCQRSICLNCSSAIQVMLVQRFHWYPTVGGPWIQTMTERVLHNFVLVLVQILCIVCSVFFFLRRKKV